MTNNTCLLCGNDLSDKWWICVPCFFNSMVPRIKNLKPSRIRDKQWSDLFIPEIGRHIPDFLQKDLTDLLACLVHELWTPAVMMTTRILEREFKGRIKKDATDGGGVPRNLGEVTQFLSLVGFPENMLADFDALRRIRNRAMHGETRFDPTSALDVTKKTLAFVTILYNMRR